MLGFTPILCVHLLNLFNGPLRRRRAFDKNNFTPTGSICMYVMYVCRNSACDYNIDDDFIFSTLADGNPKYWIQPYIDDCTVASSSVSMLNVSTATICNPESVHRILRSRSLSRYIFPRIRDHVLLTYLKRKGR